MSNTESELTGLSGVFAHFDFCPICRNGLDTGLECDQCGADWMPLQKAVEEQEKAQRGTDALREAFGPELWAMGHPAYVVVHLREELEKVTRLWKQDSWQLDDVSKAVGTHEFMDPPDGGSVTLAEQVYRMRAELTASRERVELLARWLGFMWDKYENGDACSEDGTDDGVYLGNCIRLTHDEQESILKALAPASDAKEDK